MFILLFIFYAVNTKILIKLRKAGKLMFEHVLKASLEDHRIITIIYQKGSEITERKIRVLNITGDKVKAYCYLRRENRIFKKDNILSAAFYNNYAVYLNNEKSFAKL
jgi:predicted DNA-binding transcriptional regulator YafY